jgi:hypothetical protein
MRIGIDISQIAHEGTGVAVYVTRLVTALVSRYPEHEYVLFGASLRKSAVFHTFAETLRKKTENIRLVSVKLPPTFLSYLWNTLHIVPVELFIGAVDVFWSSDWTQPPLRSAKGITTIHDLSIMRYPEESHNRVTVRGGQLRANIVKTHTERLTRAVRVCSLFFCDSEATKEDAIRLLNIPPEKLAVVYPGLSK